MEYGLVLKLHTLVGAIALFSFWSAALARKGTKAHRTAGKIYLISILLILISVIPMIVVNIERKSHNAALGLAFLFLMTVAAAWIARTAILYKQDVRAYKNPVYYALASLLTLFAVVILVISVKGGSFLYGFFACTGMALAASMWHLVIQKQAGLNWHLSQHLNGIALLFAATHGSFLRFGLTKLIPLVPDTQDFNTISQTSVILLALMLRLTAGEKFLKKRKRTRTCESVVAETNHGLPQ